MQAAAYFIVEQSEDVVNIIPAQKVIFITSGADYMDSHLNLSTMLDLFLS